MLRVSDPVGASDQRSETAGSADGWVSSQAGCSLSRRLLAVLRGRPRILVPVRQYRISTYYRNVGNPDRYSCTAVQEISAELISHYCLGVNATFTTSPIVCLYLGICSSPYITPQCLKWSALHNNTPHRGKNKKREGRKHQHSAEQRYPPGCVSHTVCTMAAVRRRYSFASWFSCSRSS
eukprot:SAG25_NODE_16_length_24288_cov_31.926950_13_plen_179_part_00